LSEYFVAADSGVWNIFQGFGCDAGASFQKLEAGLKQFFRFCEERVERCDIGSVLDRKKNKDLFDTCCGFPVNGIKF